MAVYLTFGYFMKQNGLEYTSRRSEIQEILDIELHWGLLYLELTNTDK